MSDLQTRLCSTRQCGIELGQAEVVAENIWLVLETESRLPKEGRAAFLEVFAKQPEHSSNGANEPHQEDSLYEATRSPGRRGGVSMINASWPDSFQANSKVDAPYR